MPRKLLLAALCLTSAINLLGQANSSATLQGTITDKTGAVVPNASVRITNKTNGLAQEQTSNASGIYRFELLPAGSYSVRVSFAGFATLNTENVTLAVGQTTTVDVSISPSQQAETVTVESAGVQLLDVQKTDISLPITTNQIENLPLNGRDFANLAFLAPGARPVNSFDPTKNRVASFATNGSNGRNVNV
ncbi:MAG TPA: carboxypeptidase-like regulatory domain-containing protein, partial [Bryobacteraceae bacterium]|nr:carboxypeptidase-like regulatory domain-containing protein [Bryobacteraceae bacterium]